MRVALIESSNRDCHNTMTYAGYVVFVRMLCTIPEHPYVMCVEIVRILFIELLSTHIIRDPPPVHVISSIILL